MLNFFKSHILTFFISVFILTLIFLLLPEGESGVIIKDSQLKKVTQARTSGVLANLNNGEEDVIDYLASIKNKRQLTLFGSSEFNYSDYATYKFFPNKMGRQVFGFGHAHHQHLSILVELLASDEVLDESKVCIFLSPGWFQDNGTNSGAFVEFATPELLSRIIASDVDNSYKSYIGKYIYSNKGEFAAFPRSYSYLSKVYLSSQNSKWLSIQSSMIKKMQSLVGYSYALEKINYEIELSYLTDKKWEVNFDEQAIELKETFLNSITNNELIVSDEYYSKYLLDENGIERSSLVEKLSIEGNQEYEDFKIVLKYLKEKNVEASFIILPLNPYYYQDLDNLTPLIDSITNRLNEVDIPYYNMFVSSKEKYDPGMLRDVMHIGDYGWMKVNKYLDSLYYGN